MLTPIPPRPPPNDPFITDVDIRERERRSRTVERVLLVGWGVIGAKAAFAYWADKTYGLPFDPGWLVWPSVAFALLCTGVYFWRIRG